LLLLDVLLLEIGAFEALDFFVFFEIKSAYCSLSAY
jgi:hypothetical protein